MQLNVNQVAYLKIALTPFQQLPGHIRSRNAEERRNDITVSLHSPGEAEMKKICNSINAKAFLQGKLAFPVKKPLKRNLLTNPD